ncbi:expressed unknown protein [Seminavis robusta]|uniref:Sulfotransferase n=1 Tax=Seminavis robusta TaxID=568900 RepID=A0A9N8HWQ3_9STRA|nr:expressed unknown protein [Seminavis robusta]|eukprot:Sro2241_g320340.1 n/a (544) ;mRNA; f:3661-5292
MSPNNSIGGSGNTANNKPRRHYVGLCLQASMVGLLIAASVANRGLWESSSSSPIPTNSLKLESTTTTVTTRLHHQANQGQTATSESATIFSAEEAKEHYQYHDSHSSPSKGQTTVSSDSDSSQSSLLSLKEAKEFLMQGARERTKKELVHQQEEEKQDSSNNNNNNNNKKKRDFVLPPLESLISNNNNNNRQPKILADVQFLLDFAVVGFGKCGTTTLLQWLQQTNSNSTTSTQSVQVRAPSYEAQFLVNRRPTQLVRKLYQFAVEEQELQQTQDARILKGFKNPSDIRRPHSRALLTKYWPDTPLIVTVRHPVQWMVSIYNYFKIEKGRHKATIEAAQIVDRGGRDHEGNTHHYVSTAKGEFHAILATLGKTALTETQEWNLLSPWLDPATTRDDILEQRLPNPIFFMELQQLADTNVTRARQFRNDLEHFLGLPRDHLPPALHVRPNTQHIKSKNADKLEALKLDICASENAPILQEMMDISRAASQWLRHYFIVSPGVTVSSPDYMHELLKGWMISPCPNDENDNQEEQPFVRGYKPPLL